MNIRQISRNLPARGRMRGFTLVELMISVAIIGILAGVALPSYQKYVIKARRSAAQSSMTDISNLEQQYFLTNRAYTSSLSSISYTLPSEVSTKYTASVTTGKALDSSCAVADESTVPSFVVTMTPISTGTQASDGALYLSSTGVKCPNGKW